MTTELRIQGFHTDHYGHANNARYLEFLEQGRWDYITAHLDRNVLSEQNWGFFVVNIDIHYKQPAMFEDLIEVHTALDNIGLVKTTMRQKILRKTDQQLLAHAKVQFVVMDLTQEKVMRIQGLVKTYLETGKLNE